jgi:uncharacterized membrane protein YphA (DoxX/SURF4 family)
MATPAQISGADTGQLEPRSEIAGQRETPTTAYWSPALRLIFRLCFVYFTLFSLSNQILDELLIIPKIDVPDLGIVWPLRQMTFWTARHVFHVTRELVYTGSGSGDKTFDWAQAFLLLSIAVIATVVWSVVDRRRTNYVVLHKWFRLVMRFVLASEMLLYGFSKVIPLQMPFPYLRQLVEPFGNFSPMGVLWWSVGASPAYEIFAGSAETLGAILLIIPRTATLGALVCLADLTQVFMLNMTYDVPVKLFSFHLILISLFLLAPEAARIRDFFLRDQTVPRFAQPKLLGTPRANRTAIAAQLLFGLYLTGMNVYGSIQAWHQRGGGRAKPALYGIWDVEQMSIEGVVRSPLLTDYDRWRRVLFDSPSYTSFQRMDESFANFGSSIDDGKGTLTLTKGGDKNWKGSLSFNRPAPDQLVLDGTMGGHKINMQLRLVDRSKLMLLSRGFHWINEYPYQR